MEKRELAGIIEALLFATDAPLSLERLRATVEEEDATAIREALDFLRGEYEESGRAFQLRQVAGGYQLASHPRFSPWVARLFRGRPRPRLSRPALETLAVIAYRQPVSRAEIEAIRGVNVDGVLRTLLEKRLVTVTGRREAPGRPLVFGTTREFLAYFGLADLRELPEEGELEELLAPPPAGTAAEEESGPHESPAESVPGAGGGELAP